MELQGNARFGNVCLLQTDTFVYSVCFIEHRHPMCLARDEPNCQGLQSLREITSSQCGRLLGLPF